MSRLSFIYNELTMCLALCHRHFLSHFLLYHQIFICLLYFILVVSHKKIEISFHQIHMNIYSSYVWFPVICIMLLLRFFFYFLSWLENQARNQFNKTVTIIFCRVKNSCCAYWNHTSRCRQISWWQILFVKIWMLWLCVIIMRCSCLDAIIRITSILY